MARRSELIRAALLALAVGCQPAQDRGAAGPCGADPCVSLAGMGLLVAGASAAPGVTVSLPGGLAAGDALLFTFQHPWFGAGGGTPQADDRGAPGFTEVLAPKGAVIDRAAAGVDPGPLRLRWPSALPPGTAVRIGVSGLPVQRFTESAWWPLVLLQRGGAYVELETLDPRPVVAGAPATLRLIADHRGGLRVGVEDRFRNAVPDLEAEVAVDGRVATVRTGPRGELAVFPTPPTERTGAPWAATRWSGEARLPDGQVLRATSNPVPRGAGWPTLWYGDLHGHTALSDGAGTPDEAFDHARDVAGVDFAALTEHGWQLDDGEWAQLQAAVAAARREGTFGALLAYEYDLGGDRCVYFRGDDVALPLHPSGPRRQWQISLQRRAPVAPPAPTRFAVDPSRLQAWLPQDALEVPHTVASPWMGDHGERLPRAGAWEVASAHGQSDDASWPRAVAGFDPAGALRAMSQAGVAVPLIAAGDDHGGHLGRTVWGPHPGGYAAVEAERPDGPMIWDAIRAGRSHAVVGRPLLSAAIERDGGGDLFVLHAVADQRFLRVEVLVDGAVVHGEDVDAERVDLRVPIAGDGPVIARLLEPAGTSWTTSPRLRPPDRPPPAPIPERPAAGPTAPFPLRPDLIGGATLHPMRRPNVDLGRIAPDEPSWTPSAEAVDALRYVGPDGAEWQVLVARPDDGSHDRTFLRATTPGR